MGQAAVEIREVMDLGLLRGAGAKAEEELLPEDADPPAKGALPEEVEATLIGVFGFTRHQISVAAARIPSFNAAAGDAADRITSPNSPSSLLISMDEWSLV